MSNSVPMPMGSSLPLGLTVVPQYVANGMALAVTGSEITATIMFGGRPVFQLAMAPVAAKTFANQLVEGVKEYEAKMDTKILTEDEVLSRRGQST